MSVSAGEEQTMTSLETYQPHVQQIISDHAGTVLDEPGPEPSLAPLKLGIQLFKEADKNGAGLGTAEVRLQSDCPCHSAGLRTRPGN